MFQFQQHIWYDLSKQRVIIASKEHLESACLSSNISSFLAWIYKKITA